MTYPQDLLRLADEVAAATGPDRRLDITIAIAVGAVRADYERASQHGEALPYFWHKTDSHAPLWMPERYTALLDAAMTLIPSADRWHTRLAMEDRHSHSWRWELRGGFGWDAQARAATPALALASAALKARAHSTKDTSNVG